MHSAREGVKLKFFINAGWDIQRAVETPVAPKNNGSTDMYECFFCDEGTGVFDSD